MRHVDGRLTFSATDLTNFLECEHLTQLDVLRARGEIELIEREDPGGDLIRRKGIEHEQAYLERLKGEGRDVAEIPEGPEGPAATIEAMRRGAEVVYQAAFDDGEWTGYADFLFRVETPSDLGGWSYEPADTKLAREPKPYFLLQLCSYAEQLARLQGVAPERVHLVLGDGRLEAYRRADFDAYYRTIKARFLEEVARARETYPWPVRHCDICRWKDRCASQREADDHLSLVASIRRSQILRLNESGILTMDALAKAAPPVAVPRIGAGTAERLRLQAELQVRRRETGEHRYELLPPDGRRRGFALLPEPCDGDVFFDMEGDPFAEGGLEYLFGVVTVDGGSPAYRAWWAHQRLEEKRALEELVDFITERLTRWPDLHVYHYASYEPSALKRLMGTHGTREEEVDRLLRGGVLVDLYAVVRQGVRISQPSYSLKMVEAFYMPPRTEAITEAGSSIVAYERWIDTADADLLHQIEEYNAVDCASTYLLREWLLGLRAEAASRFAADGRRRPSAASPPRRRGPPPPSVRRSRRRSPARSPTRPRSARPRSGRAGCSRSCWSGTGARRSRSGGPSSSGSGRRPRS